LEKIIFAFEELDVWQKSVEYAAEVIRLIEKIETARRHYRLIEQLEAACTSVALNIAEGKGRYSKKEFIQFLYIARGSLYETIALLTIFHKNNWIDDQQLEKLRQSADEIARMIAGLIGYIKKSMKTVHSS
jgi:four helix bundle protein